MEEIKVGEYIKTVAGYIGKIISFSDGMYTVKMKDATIDLYIDDIKNHKENIIDLIEQGDYVNGEKVVCFRNTNCDYDIGTEYNGEFDVYYGYDNEQIKDIVTKEQFNQMKYIVGDESNE